MLWQHHQLIQKPEYVPAWKFVGELYIPEIDEHFFMSYKCPANGVAIHFENPGMIDRRQTTGRSGARYYEYRLVPDFEANMVEPKLKEFYQRLTNTVAI